MRAGPPAGAALAPPVQAAPPPVPALRPAGWRRRATVLAALGAALGVALVLSATRGAAPVPLGGVLEAITAFDPADADHHVVRQIRLPRVLAGALVGASLAVAGALMQGVTRNPLASPGIMGLTAGAHLALTAGVLAVPGLVHHWAIALSMGGAVLGVAAVLGIALLAPDGLTPIKLALAGVTLSTVLGGLTALLVHRAGRDQEVMLYFAGGFVGTTWRDVAQLLPACALGVAVALALARDVTVLGLGDDVAAGLGQRSRRVKAAASAAVVLLVGGAVSVAGPVGFVGLVAPHVARSLLGLDYRWIVPGAALVGAFGVALADLGARSLNPPIELPVGVVTAAIGVPFLLVLARRTDVELS